MIKARRWTDGVEHAAVLDYLFEVTREESRHPGSRDPLLELVGGVFRAEGGEGVGHHELAGGEAVDGGRAAAG